VVVVLGLAAGCQRPKELRVPLDYRPTDKLEIPGVTIPSGVHIAVVASDKRDDPSAIGRNDEEKVPVPIYATDLRTPDQFLRDVVSRELGNAGLIVASEPGGAPRVLHLTLTQFWIDETSRYHGMVVADAELTAGRQRLWQGRVSGSNERFGRSLSAENYQEVFTDSTIDLVQNLLRAAGFVPALTQAPPHAPAGKRRR